MQSPTSCGSRLIANRAMICLVPIGALRGLLARFFPRGALLLSALTFAGYLMGLIRDRAFARTYGAGPELDAYNAALALPELTLNVLVASGLTAAFVPVFTGLAREDEPAAHDFGRTVLTASVVLMAVADALLFVLAPATASLVVPGFDAEQRELYTALFRVMCVTAVIFAAALALGEVLVVKQRFLAYGLAPVLYNGGIVFGTVALSPALGIFGAAVGTVIGALLYLGIRVAGAVRAGFRIHPNFAVRTGAFAEYVRLMLPKMLSQPIEPLTFLYFTSVASTFVAGSVSALSFARNFGSVPVSLIGVAFSIAAFPILAAAAAAGDRARFLRLVTTNILTITVLTVVAAMGLVLLAGVAIELLLGGEAFTAEDVALTSLLLAAFGLSVPLESLSQLLSRAIYATRNTLLPVIASIAGLAVTVAFVQLLAPRIGVAALPLGFATGMGVKVVLLGLSLAARVRHGPGGGQWEGGDRPGSSEPGR